MTIPIPSGEATSHATPNLVSDRSAALPRIDAMCHERTRALQQAKCIGWLFNYLVGHDKQSARHREAERSSSIGVDH
jgi:hypothetical protein